MKKVLCFGDSNTWGYDPCTKNRFPKEVRWTGILQGKLKYEDTKIIEEGLVGRTTVYEDLRRPGLKGIENIIRIFDGPTDIDAVVLMLGTNDCKTANKTTPKDIARGIDKCLDVILKYVPAEKVLLISPIHLGKNVWKKEFDPEFSEESVRVSKGLKKEYSRIAAKRGVNFLAAADYVSPSSKDQEHLNEAGHSRLANIIYNKLINMNVCCAC
ncbi:Lysophospholipase L1 [Eubacterium ruminantium]|jgi:lysophospholipase L1-like esterase|uniref:Lysophospholipase L1 n=1 Tax=Eubacterium ruminantium TaxID=42322 RepID=A0A1T4KH67_9FIRM|nr:MULTISPECIES: GDSL-type esterase/lipase family protein [Eubacterium]MCR5368684.1 arylesterase [Eubacterium sp.]SCW32022.1 Lysophospholipase L1 [Eubacterium ruminantium]SDM27038.1 Lysophospholipase L1 [Eubacterium ruminantium]SJZ41762.1 Lysophospholipase L1 [Eubacterium ruminantium]